MQLGTEFVLLSIANKKTMLANNLLFILLSISIILNAALMYFAFRYLKKNEKMKNECHFLEEQLKSYRETFFLSKSSSQKTALS
jgi:membrane-anchored glycerophosphoryl diester phosphodiesterase (GDPDase)